LPVASAGRMVQDAALSEHQGRRASRAPVTMTFCPGFARQGPKEASRPQPKWRRRQQGRTSPLACACLRRRGVRPQLCEGHGAVAKPFAAGPGCAGTLHRSRIASSTRKRYCIPANCAKDVTTHTVRLLGPPLSGFCDRFHAARPRAGWPRSRRGRARSGEDAPEPVGPEAGPRGRPPRRYSPMLPCAPGRRVAGGILTPRLPQIRT